MTDLSARLRAVVEERLAVARAATPGPWTTEGNSVNADAGMKGMVVAAVGACYCYTVEARRQCSYECGWPVRADAKHIALNDPADVILACERDLAVLERHAVVIRREYFVGKGMVDDPQCEWCELRSNDGEPLGRPWPCDEIRDLATRYRVEVE